MIPAKLLLSLLFIFTTLQAKPSIFERKIQGRLNIINGASTECVMHYFYASTGWAQIEGEIGRNGIDGLYYKQKGGAIKEVLVAESKWNTSKLGLSGKGKTVKQMSQEWVMRTMDKLIHKMDTHIYRTLRTLIQHNQYRARLFRMKPGRGNTIKITIYKIKNKGRKVFDEFIDSRLRPIDINAPRNTFERRIVKAYNGCRRRYLHKYLGVLSDTQIDQLLQDNYLQKKDILRILPH